jgi:hypothetical protein
VEAKGSNPTTSRKFAATIWYVLVSVATLLSLGGYYTFVPRLSVSASSALNPSDPFSTPFILSNDGNLSIYAIKYSCELNLIETDTDIVFKNSRISNFTSQRTELEPSGKDTFSCPFSSVVGFSGPRVAIADVTLAVSFQTYFNYPSKRTFRFVTETASDKKLYWFHRSK